VLFDLDGTLVDTADDFIPVVQQLRADAGRPAMDAERIRATVSNGARALVELALDIDEGHPQFEDWRQRLLTLYAGILGRHARPYPGMRELLADLEARGLCWGIATNKPRELTHSLLAQLDLQAGSVVCPEDVKQRKPHPESLELACRELACAPGEAVYVGDHARDIEAGRGAGLYTIAAAYGYIEPGDAATAWGADAIIERSTDLAALLFSPRSSSGEADRRLR
jgi:phosphoglycolate phosphatase